MIIVMGSSRTAGALALALMGLGCSTEMVVDDTVPLDAGRADVDAASASDASPTADAASDDASLSDQVSLPDGADATSPGDATPAPDAAASGIRWIGRFDLSDPSQPTAE
jgi:hypothetical protein